MVRKNIIPYERVGRIMEYFGAERISSDAKSELSMYLEEYIIALAKNAEKYSAHAKRITIRGEDIKLAIKSMNS